MAEEFYTVPESPEYNAAAIRKIQDTDPVRASTIVNPVVQQMITNTHAVKLQADQNTKAASAAAGLQKMQMKGYRSTGSSTQCGTGSSPGGERRFQCSDCCGCCTGGYYEAGPYH